MYLFQRHSKSVVTGDVQMASVLAFYSNNPSLVPAEVCNFYSAKSTRQEWKQTKRELEWAI